MILLPRGHSKFAPRAKAGERGGKDKQANLESSKYDFPVTLYFARHGESEANVLKIFANDGGPYGLTERGREQAEDLAELLVPEGITSAYASPLLRAQQTAEIVCGRLKIPFETRYSLKEFGVGSHEGCCDKAAWEEYGMVERAWLIEGDTQARIGGGECFDDIKRRFLPFIQELDASFGHSEQKILLIGHGGTFACMLPLILKNVDKAFAQAHPLRPASTVVATNQGDGLVCLRWTDTPFEVPPYEDLEEKLASTG